MSRSPTASELFERGRAAQDAGDEDEAERCYRASTDLAPQAPATWYNLGLLYKRQRRWPESLACNVKALALDGQEESTIWNTGIAATAVGDWRTARDAWSRLGLAFPAAEGFVDLALGAVPIRISVDLHPEVVWCDRLDPVRARIRNVPTPESERRYFDIVLNDGEPVGERLWNGQRRAVFNELMLIERSPFRTFAADVTACDEAAMAALLTQLDGDDVVAEDWTGSIELLCKQCSEASADARAQHHRHDTDSEGWRSERVVGIAALDATPVRARLAEWQRGGPGRAVRTLEQRL